MIDNSIIPWLTLASSTKSASVTVVSVYLLNVIENFNLSAPGAFSFEVPVELSNNDPSVAELTSVSLTVRPILYEGVEEYFSSINSCAGTLTKKPLTNTIPSDMFAIEANPLGLSTSVCDLTVNSLRFVDTISTAPVSDRVTS